MLTALHIGDTRLSSAEQGAIKAGSVPTMFDLGSGEHLQAELRLGIVEGVVGRADAGLGGSVAVQRSERMLTGEHIAIEIRAVTLTAVLVLAFLDRYVGNSEGEHAARRLVLALVVVEGQLVDAHLEVQGIGDTAVVSRGVGAPGLESLQGR